MVCERLWVPTDCQGSLGCSANIAQLVHSLLLGGKNWEACSNILMVKETQRA